MARSMPPVADAIRAKITEQFKPRTLEIRNDSQSNETHFHVTIASEAFKDMVQLTRHRAVYALLKDEIAQVGGIHALHLKTLTPEEVEKMSG